METREIKFRAFKEATGEMIQPACVMFCPGEIREYRVFSSSDGELLGNDKHYEIMQFTGLKDKNGTDIYEGDIVKYQDYNTTPKSIKVANVYWMCWSDWANVPFLHPFGSPVAGYYKEDERSVNTCFVTPPSACEVIGNIHQNPELL